MTRVRTRTEMVALADTMLRAARPYGSPGHARITLPGAPGGYGTDVDGLEGFARTLLLAGFRLAGEPDADPDGLAEWYAEGFAAGTDPHSAERWVRPSEHGQAKVEAASLALILDMTRPLIWDRLAPLVQEQVVDYLAEVVGDTTYPRNNWLWFRVTVETFLRSVGGHWSADDIADDLAKHDSYYRGDGWFSDGEERSFDHYVGWAMHLYPVLWSRMQGAAELTADLAPGRAVDDVARLDRFLLDAVHLVGADGGPLLQGRSLTYKFAAAAPFWAGAIAEVPSTAPGLLRRAGTGIVDHFAQRGSPDGDGLLTLGLHRPWRGIAQTYSGTGSPYWAAKGMLGIALPAEHPVWTAPDAALPVEEGDALRAVGPAGWVVSGTRADGVVRIANHGTDHAHEGDLVGDSPLYARIGYSTATFPLIDEASTTDPSDQSVVLLDAHGRATHRAGMRCLQARVDRPDDGSAAAVAVAASDVSAHWLDVEPAGHDHGSGRTGTPRAAGDLRVVSLLRGPWELRLVRVERIEGIEGAEPGTTPELRISGWPVAGEPDEVGTTSGDRQAAAAAGALRSTVVSVLGAGRPEVLGRSDGSPFGDAAAVPAMAFPALPGSGPPS
ncbi:hypothetical protein GCM10025865_07720 [Paraoerskovia sediminicola]|uniref:DUF2264 domain-containing protein n=1 Tax=Paraoerskovia sediminicola TaxID=1138587 RepID=A0ABM8G0J1_9CELL|nr:DUF2264 domain-containing protein [Paraoerskovia sediminicola]BDZ41473.1 hypothetical protein GCM10025865_07720 [Paraoerskovia sediminicola]